MRIIFTIENDALNGELGNFDADCAVDFADYVILTALVKRPSDHCKTAEFLMKVCWKEDTHRRQKDQKDRKHTPDTLATYWQHTEELRQKDAGRDFWANIGSVWYEIEL